MLQHLNGKSVEDYFLSTSMTLEQTHTESRHFNKQNTLKTNKYEGKTISWRKVVWPPEADSLERSHTRVRNKITCINIWRIGDTDK